MRMRGCDCRFFFSCGGRGRVGRTGGRYSRDDRSALRTCSDPTTMNVNFFHAT